MKVAIDNREKDRATRGLKYFKKQGYTPVITTLKYGDFGFHDNNITVAFEYKTISDFISSIEDNRVFNQALNQSNTFDYHFIIIVGDEADYKKAVKTHGYHSGRYVGMSTWNGSIASLVNFTSVLTAKNESWAFDLMERVALKCTSDKPVIHRFPKSRGSPAFRFLVNNVSRIGTKTAENICDTLQLDCLADVFSVTESDLVKVDGIGEKKAGSIVGEIWKGYLM